MFMCRLNTVTMYCISQRWTGHFFDRESLRNLGLRLQLGHEGSACPCPSAGPPGFMIFDNSGVHSMNIDYCDCPNDDVPDRRTQLLRQGWFPATFTRPNTVITFDCLETFHELTLQGKVNLYDFYHTLLRKTDNANVFDSIVCYLPLTQISLHLLILLSIDIRSFTGSFGSGGISWSSSVLVEAMILKE
jgi:hypothetical protein